ncbi:MAG TPA: CheR family methyltransferase, partial [Anaerolineales bacterium]|nr:CheR family methyltransferase [Anaerolineales bacterium]
EEGIRIWSIGCATGEEAYGLAMLLMEESEKQDFHTPLQVFASDLDERSISRAREGLYPAAIEADLSPERLERFFTREGEYYHVKRELRDIVLFTNHNIMRDPPFSRQDLIACRNVLIYLQRSVQDKLFDIFHYSLKPGGYLFMGSSESAEHLPALFSIVDKTHRLYQARPWNGEAPHVPSMPLSSRKALQPQEEYVIHRPHEARFPEGSALLEEQHRTALENYGPPSVIVNERYGILHISETAGRYLHHPKGTITGDLLALVRPELQPELRSVLFRAFEKARATVSRPVAVQLNGHRRRVIITVRLSEQSLSQMAERQALVFFIEDEEESIADSVADIGVPRNEADRDETVAQLQSEIRNLREQLQITTEEYDSSNEEMKSANEELQSINEEYRSAAEELETSKEELQSVNEELQTVNSEMRSKLDEISQAHQELENLMGATEIATLYLDRELNIQRFTAGVQELFSIRSLDRGRRISDLAHQLGYENFSKDAEQVLRNLIPLEREIEKGGGNWFVMRMRPYRTVEDRIEGVVVSFIDITKLKQTEQEMVRIKETLEHRVEERTRELDEASRQITQARDLFENLFALNPVPTSITRLEDGVFINVNEAYLKYFSLTGEDLIGHAAQELGLPLEPTIRPKLIARVQQQGFVQNIEMETKLPSGEIRTILVSVQVVKVSNTDALMLAFIDITEHVLTAKQARTAANSLSASDRMERQRISQVLHDDLQQNLFAVKMQLSFLDDAIAKGKVEAANVDLKQLDQWLAEAIATTRQLSIDLSPPVLPAGEGLTESLIWLASQMKTQYNMEVTLDPNGTQAVLDDDVRSLLLQSVRELLFNVVKHSGTLNAQVALEQMNGQVKIIVSDQGKGFDLQSKTDKDFNGLKKMRNRLYLVGANLEIQSAPDTGTQITIEAPVADTME